MLVRRTMQIGLVLSANADDRMRRRAVKLLVFSAGVTIAANLNEVPDFLKCRSDTRFRHPVNETTSQSQRPVIFRRLGARPAKEFSVFYVAKPSSSNMPFMETRMAS